jgi:cell pole-organizing protein PopZ
VREFSARPSAPAPRLVSRDESPLVSEQTDMAVTSSFQVLGVARSMPTSQTVDAMAREMLRPMLKEWLDDHLPTLVEKLVRAEIERGSRGR